VPRIETGSDFGAENGLSNRGFTGLPNRLFDALKDTRKSLFIQ
jgi:hypothetical protein